MEENKNNIKPNDDFKLRYLVYPFLYLAVLIAMCGIAGWFHNM